MSELESMRKAYGETLAELGEKHPEIVVLDADLSQSTKTFLFAKKFPNRFFDMGVAEQSLAGTAAGFASCGKIPYMSTFAMFATGRCYDQVRNSICYSNFNVKICATHGGITVGEDGSSHQMLEDLSLMRGLPNMRVFIPADARETRILTQALLNYNGPCYMRVSRMSVEPVYPEIPEYKEEAVVMREGKDVSIIACGLLVKEALIAAERLKKAKINAEVVNMHTLKPLDEKQVLKSAKNCGRIVTAEENTINGGLGSAVASVLGENYPVPMQRIGIQDIFGQSGKPMELMDVYGLTAKHIYKAVKNVMGRKK